MGSNKVKTALFIPAYNEEDNVYNLLEHCKKYIAKEDIYVLDNASTDNTVNMAKLAGVNVRHNYKNLGIGGSLCHNLKHAPSGYDSILCMDAGWSHDPEDIPQFLSYAQYFTIGHREDWQAPLKRKLISKVARYLISKKSGLRSVPEGVLIDWTSGFRNYPCDILSNLYYSGWFDLPHAQGHAFQFEIAYKIAKSNILIEVPITHYSSNRSLTWKILWEAIATLWNL